MAVAKSKRTRAQLDMRVEDVTSFVQQVKFIAEKWLPSDDNVVGPWFRGQGNAEWPLIPKFYRTCDQRRETDDEIREEFAQRGPAFCQFPPSGDWDWYFMMQHHGAPTRLLDWTDGALIALYFAVRDSRGLTDSAVWMLDPFWLNRHTLRKDVVISPSASGALPEDKKLLQRWLHPRFEPRARLPQNPVALYPGHIAQRISTQRSCFTIHGANPAGLEELAVWPTKRLVKFSMPGYRTQAIRKELAICGIDEATAFPDLDGLGRALGARWGDDDFSLPHEAVFTRLRPSRRHGIGVFAIRPIPRGTKLFRGDSDDMRWIKSVDVGRLPSEVRRLYDDFCVLKAGRLGCPTSFDRLTPSWYLNNSKDPNVVCDEHLNFIAKRPIASGEELTVDYSTYSEEVTSSPSKKRKGR
jgi:hypothetical protein